MPKTIIIPLDGSVAATHAIPTGAWLSTSFDADLRLLTTTFGDDETSGHAILSAAAPLAGAAPVHTEVRTGRFASSGILEAAETTPDPVICMSTLGHGGQDVMVLGSVAEDVLGHAAVPVVLVGPRCRDVLDDPQDMVLCITEPAERAVMVPLANRWASELGLRLHIVQGLAHDEEPPGEGQLFHRWEPHPKVGLTIDVRQEAATADEVTVGLAHGLDACLVMVATDGRNRPLHRPTGHVATEIVRNSHCPVVVVHLPH